MLVVHYINLKNLQVLKVNLIFAYMRKIILLSVSVLLAVASNAQTKTKIALTQGQKMQVENVVNATSGQEMMGQKVETNVELKLMNQIEVKGITDSTYKLINTVKNLKAKLSAMGQDMGFDSDKKEDMSGSAASGIKDVVNKPKELVIDKSGNALNVNKTDSIKEDPSQDVIKMMIQQLLGDPNDASFGMADMFIPLPEKFVIGYSWTDSTIHTDELTKIVTYTVKNINPTEVTLSIKGVLKTKMKMEMQGMEMSNTSAGTSEGEETIDRTSSVLKKRNLTINIAGTMEAMGQEMPMTSKVVSTTTVKNP
jgi:hypothetical protein